MRSKLFTLLLLIILSSMFTGCRNNIDRRRNNIEQQRKYISPIPFEKTKWSDERGIGVEALWEIRPALARDLINNAKLIGKSRTDIIEMLGDEGNTAISPNIKSYELEPIWGWNIDPIAIEYLKISFDSENKVEKAEIEFYKTGDW